MNWKPIFVLLFSTYSAIDLVHGAKILAFFPSTTRSHVMLGQSLMKGLARAGHHVKMVSAYPIKEPVENYTDITMQSLQPSLDAYFRKGGNTNQFNRNSETIYNKIVDPYNLGLEITDLTLRDPNIRTLLASGEKFDLILINAFVNEAHFILGHIFGAPIIVFSTLGPSIWINDLVSNPSPYAYVPGLFLDFSDQMTLPQRIQNTVISFAHEMYRHFVYLPKQEAIKERHFPGSPPLDTLLRNTSLILLNAHVSLFPPRPMVHRMVEIGGFHVAPTQTLPPELERYLDGAVDGVVYFSMGSVLQSKNFPAGTRNVLFGAFAKLKQKVLWKWEIDDSLVGVPGNVRLEKWLPQQGILAHRNVKAFITHGGFSSTIEAIYYGVPVIGMPVFTDQHLNIGRAVKLGYGLRLDIDKLTVELVYEAIQKIIKNPRYSENAMKRSTVLRDQQVNPMTKAIFWVEYVLRHKGASHLQCAASKLNRAQHLLLDVLAIIILLLSGVGAIVYLLLKRYLDYSRKCKLATKKQN